MFKHIFSYRIKYYVRTKEFFFWLLIFPIILSTLFHFAFGNLLEDEAMETIEIAVVTGAETDSSMVYQEVFKGDAFKAEYTNEEEAKDLLNKDEISGYVYFDNGAHLVVKENGNTQTVLKEILDYIAQQTKTITNIYEENNGQVSPEFTAAMTKTNSYIKEITASDNAPNTIVVFFYTVLAMAAMYGAMIGVYEIINIQANQSAVAMRINGAPVSKMKIFLSNITAGILTEFLVMIIILLYIRFVLGIDFGNRYGYIALTSLVGAVTGISFGTFLSAIVKKGESMKVGIVVAFTMACSFMAGMMGSDIKYQIKQAAPIVDRLNPVNLITESYYKLYYYDGLASYWQNIIILLGMAIVFFVITIFILRRQTYDSI